MSVGSLAGRVTGRTRGAAALVLAVWLVGVGAEAPAAERVALVIGNGAYDRIQPLDNPVNDATLMGETLRELGFDVSVKTDANLRDMNTAIRTFGKRLRAAGPGAVGLFFYAGHGVQSRGRNYLIPLDAPIDVEADLELEAIRAQGVLGQMRDAGSGLNIVVLDACRSNPFPGSARSGTRGLSRIEAPKGSLIAYSASPGQVAKDGAGENSPYTAALAQAMRRPGLELRDVFQSVRKAVLARTGNEQLSWEENSLTDKWYFRAPVAGGGGLDEGDGALSGGGRVAAAQHLEIEREFWASIKGSRSPAKFRAYLDRFGENGAFAALARIELEELGGEGGEPGPAVDEAREAWEIAVTRRTRSRHTGRWRSTFPASTRRSPGGRWRSWRRRPSPRSAGRGARRSRRSSAGSSRPMRWAKTAGRTCTGRRRWICRGSRRSWWSGGWRWMCGSMRTVNVPSRRRA